MALLGGRVDSIARLGGQASAGVNVDDYALALLDHGGGETAHEPHRGEHVDLHHLLPVIRVTCSTVPRCLNNA